MIDADWFQQPQITLSKKTDMDVEGWSQRMKTQLGSYKDKPEATGIHNHFVLSFREVWEEFLYGRGGLIDTVQMATNTAMASWLLLMVVAAGHLAMVADGALIDIVNSCGDTITACAQQGSSAINCYVLEGSGGRRQLDVSSSWPSGVIWAFPGGSGDPAIGNNAKPQANLAEFTIGGSGGNDFYDLSNVEAYNFGLSIGVTAIAPGDSPGTQHCTTVTCVIPDLTSFCQAPNFLTGDPGQGCKNADGPGTVRTPGTEAFETACPDAYSFSQDDQNSTWTCGTGSNYQVTFCPATTESGLYTGFRV